MRVSSCKLCATQTVFLIPPRTVCPLPLVRVQVEMAVLQALKALEDERIEHNDLCGDVLIVNQIGEELKVKVLDFTEAWTYAREKDDILIPCADPGECTCSLRTGPKWSGKPA